MSQEQRLEVAPVEAHWDGCYIVTSGGYEVEVIRHGKNPNAIRRQQISSHGLSPALKASLIIVALVRLAFVKESVNVLIEPEAHFGRPNPLGARPDRNDGDVLRELHPLPGREKPDWREAVEADLAADLVIRFEGPEGKTMYRMGPALVHHLRTHNIPVDRRPQVCGRGPTTAQRNLGPPPDVGPICGRGPTLSQIEAMERWRKGKV